MASHATFRLAVVSATLLGACSAGSPTASDAGSDAGAPELGACPPTLRPYKTACVPVLDDCPGNQVPVPGGGCKKVGVEECELDGVPGIKAPPDWAC